MCRLTLPRSTVGDIGGFRIADINGGAQIKSVCKTPFIVGTECDVEKIVFCLVGVMMVPVISDAPKIGSERLKIKIVIDAPGVIGEYVDSVKTYQIVTFGRNIAFERDVRSGQQSIGRAWRIVPCDNKSQPKPFLR